MKTPKNHLALCTHKHQLKYSVFSKARVILTPIRGFKAYPGNLAVRDTIPLSPLQADKIPSLQDSRCGKQWLVYWYRSKFHPPPHTHIQNSQYNYTIHIPAHRIPNKTEQEVSFGQCFVEYKLLPVLHVTSKNPRWIQFS